MEEGSCTALRGCGCDSCEDERSLAKADETHDAARVSVGEGAKAGEQRSYKRSITNETDGLSAGFIESAEACFADEDGTEVTVE